MQEKDWFSVEDLAKELDISVEVVRGLIRSKQLTAYRIGKEYRIKRQDYEKFLEERKNRNN